MTDNHPTPPAAARDAAIAQAYDDWCKPRMGSFEPDHPADAFRAGYLAATTPPIAQQGGGEEWFTVGEIVTADDGRRFEFLGYGNWNELASKADGGES